MNEKLEELEKEIQKLKEKIEEKDQMIQNQIDEITELESNIYHLESNYEDIKGDYDDLESEYKDLKDECRELQFELDHSDNSEATKDEALALLQKLTLFNEFIPSKVTLPDEIAKEMDIILADSFYLLRKNEYSMYNPRV